MNAMKKSYIQVYFTNMVVCFFLLKFIDDHYVSLANTDITHKTILSLGNLNLL